MTLQLEQSLDPGHGAAAAASARSAAVRFLKDAARAGRPVTPVTADIVLLVVSELVTNAVRHTPGPCTLHLSRYEAGVGIDVSDTSPDPPVPRPPHVNGAGGWGWILVNHLAEELSVRPTPEGGKTVHAYIADRT
ncbi:ATP-binding protein [Streptomyces globosus]|uniref:ATP-binding protein n=1 Tax=Streptomyces globosus TaxID=68209 RepID=A0A344U1X9_9ACTN|nr:MULTISPECIES: ATP-binding protein [Streptomyces]AXE24900.1 ATP-binding protein [Streptomyces globosus]